MKYIPAPEPSNFGTGYIWISATSIAVIFLVLFLFKGTGPKEKRDLPTVFGGTVGATLGILLVGVVVNPSVKQLDESNSELWESHNYKTTLVTYGIDLDLDEFRALHYPENRPKVDEKVFGSIERSVDAYGVKEKQKATLLWRDGKIILAHRDGQGKFAELAPLPKDYRPKVEPEGLVRPLYAPGTGQ